MMQTLDTMGRDGPTESDAHHGSRTFDSAVRSSSPVVLALAGAAAVIALCTASSSQVPLAAALTVVMSIPPAMVDLLDRRLPNRMLIAAAGMGAVAAGLTAVSGGDVDIAGAALGAVAFAGPLLVMHLMSPASMGFGDVKAACVLGAALGLIHPFAGLVALAAGSLVGATVGLVGRRRNIAFGPALVAGAIVALALAAFDVGLVETTVDATSGVAATPSSEAIAS